MEQGGDAIRASTLLLRGMQFALVFLKKEEIKFYHEPARTNERQRKISCKLYILYKIRKLIPHKTAVSPGSSTSSHRSLPALIDIGIAFP